MSSRNREIDADHIVVTYNMAVTHEAGGRPVSFRPWQERMLMTRSQGQWRLAGNQQIARASVNFLARLGQKPLTLAELRARPDVHWEVAPWDPLHREAYYLRIPDPNNPGADIDLWIGFPEDDAFGVMAWGPSNSGTRMYRYLATPDARVRAYLLFDVSSTEIDPRVAYVNVKGPGIPSGGLNLVRSDPNHPRQNLIFRGDPWFWNTFDTGRCSIISRLTSDQIDPRDYITNCALDWSKITSGSSYVYSFRDETEASLGELTRQLLGDLKGEAAWYDARDQLFGHFTLDSQYVFDERTVIDPGSPFAGGGTVVLKWQLPTGSTVRFEGVSYWRQYPDDSLSRTQEEHWFQLYGTQDTSVAATSNVIEPPQSTSWAWAALTSRDAFGNLFDQEVSPNNPY